MRIKIDIKAIILLVLLLILVPSVTGYCAEPQTNSNSASYDTVTILNAFAKAMGHNADTPEENASYMRATYREPKATGSTVDYLTVAKIGNELKGTPPAFIAAVGAIPAFEKSTGGLSLAGKSLEQVAARIGDMNFSSTPGLENNRVVTPLEMNKTIETQNESSVAAAEEEADNIATMGSLELNREKDALQRDALKNVIETAKAATAAAIEAAVSGGTAEETAKQKKAEAEKAVENAAKLLPNETAKINAAAQNGADAAVNEAKDKGVAVDSTAVATALVESLGEIAKQAQQVAVNNELAKQDSAANPSGDTNTDNTANQPATTEPAPTATPAPVTVETTGDNLKEEIRTQQVDAPQEVSSA